MNEQAILHIPESKYCFAVNDKTVVLRLRVTKGEAIKSVQVVYGSKYEYGKVQFRELMELSYQDRLFDYYTVKLVLEDVRLVYVFEIMTADDEIYFYSEDGLSKVYDYVYAFYNAFQLPYINNIDVQREVEWMKKGAMYQIFVDRFEWGNTEKDTSYINLKWGDIPNPKSYAGGDLKGITNRLDYISSLGVTTIYLTPIFKAESNHKYNISDYMKIDEQFGTHEDFRELVEKAHEKDLKIVLDAVFNHCSDNAPEFVDVVKKGEKSQYYDWFVIKGDTVDKEKCNYECFAACEYMPKLNTSNLEVQKYLIDIAKYWIEEYKIDGWRLDVSDELSHNFWKKFREEIKGISQEVAIIGENWHDANPFLRGDEYDSIMNYAVTKACLDLFAFGKYNIKEFAYKLNELLMRNTDTVNNMMLNLLDSHDTHRFYSEVKKDNRALMAALAILYFYPGMPCIFYGTENNMEGGFDPDCRRTMDWEVSVLDNPTKDLIRKLNKIKKDGYLATSDVKISETEEVLYMTRYCDKGEKIVLEMNFSGQPHNIEVDSKDIIVSNLYENNYIQEYGLVIYKI